MTQLNIIFPDGAKKEYPQGTTGEDIAGSISPGLRRDALAIKIDGEFIDLKRPLQQGGQLEIITYRDEEGIDIMRHSTAHIFAQAVSRLYDDVQFGVGPVIDEGFYYDIDMDHPLTPDDLPKIEKEMQRIVDANLEVSRIEVSREEAKKMFQDIGDELKIELIDDIPEDEPITIYKQGEFFDLCRGVHVQSTSNIKVFKLLRISGAYLRGDSSNKQLQRVYGTAFEKQKDLEDYLHLLEERKERDHRKLGKELELFTINQKVGQGIPVW